MSKPLILMAIVAGVSACAARAPRRTTSVHYSCGDTKIVHSGEQLIFDLAAKPPPPTTLGWRDRDGDHFLSWPRSTTDAEAVEYVIPPDRHSDAIERVYDRTTGDSTASWRKKLQRVCRVEGGYSDALTRYLAGASLDEIASALALEDRSRARELVHAALMNLQRKYHRDR